MNFPCLGWVSWCFGVFDDLCLFMIGSDLGLIISGFFVGYFGGLW